VDVDLEPCIVFNGGDMHGHMLTGSGTEHIFVSMPEYHTVLKGRRVATRLEFDPFPHICSFPGVGP
jgi:CTP-dependent riboflavin kinase